MHTCGGLPRFVKISLHSAKFPHMSLEPMSMKKMMSTSEVARKMALVCETKNFIAPFDRCTLSWHSRKLLLDVFPCQTEVLKITSGEI